MVLVLHYGVIENRFSSNEVLTMQTEVFNTIRTYCEEGMDVFYTGDLNVHLGDEGKLRGNNPTKSPGGKSLLKFIELENLYLSNWDNKNHTHWDRSGGHSNILDIMISNAQDKIESFEVDTKLNFTPYRVRKVKGGLQKKFTDHLSLLTTVNTQVKTSLKTHKITSWNYFKQGGDERFRDEMDKLALVINDEINNSTSSINEIHSLILRGIDNIKREVYGKTSVTKKQFQRLSDHALWSKRMKEVENSIHGLKKYKITDRIWEMRNNISYKFKDKQFVSVTDPSTGKLTQSKEDTFKTMLDYNFNLLRKDLTEKSDKVIEKERVKGLVTESAMLCDTPVEDVEFTWKELMEVIDKVKIDNKKVYRDLTKSGPIFHNSLLNFFNKCYKEECIPDEWSETELMKLYKNKGKRTDLKMNRFIHLKPFMPKTFEKLLMKKIETRLANKTPEFQIGGRKNSSTTEHLLTLIMFMKRLERDQGGGICQFMDIRTCFDHMTLSDSLFECSEAGIVGKPLRMVHKVTNDLKIKIQGDHDSERMKQLDNCLGQGTVYEPTGTGITMASSLEVNMAAIEAEKVYNDENFSLTPQVGPITLTPLVFVDDMSKTCRDSNESASMGLAITETLTELKMKAHDEKSGLLVFGKNKNLLKEEIENNPTFIQGFKMGFKEKETYLGMQFSENGSQDSIMITLEARRIKCYIKASELRKKLDDDRVAGIGWLATAITVFNATVVSTLTYGCGAWVGMLKKHLDHVEQTQRQCL